jgi:hypothetical protein
MKHYDPIDLARLAAYIDGEGSIQFSRGGGPRKNGWNNYSPGISVVNCDPRLIVWLQEKFGGVAFSSSKPQKSSKWRTRFQWLINGRKAIELAFACEPYLVIKREQLIAFRIYEASLLVPKNGHYVAEPAVRARWAAAEALKIFKHMRWVGETRNPSDYKPEGFEGSAQDFRKLNNPDNPRTIQ